MPQAPNYYDWGGRPTTRVTPDVDFAPMARSQPNVGDLAQGFQNLGTGIDRLREDMIRTSLAAADTANSDAQRKLLNDPETGFFNLRGKAAMDARDHILNRLDELYASNGAAFSDDPQAMRDYARIANARRETALNAIDNFVSGQRRDWMDGTSKARIESAANDAVANYTDPKSVNLFLALGRGEILDMAERNGWSGEERDAAIREFESGTHRAIISRYAATSPGEAAAYFNSVKEGLTATDAVAADSVLKQAEAEARARRAEAQAKFESDMLISLRRGDSGYAEIENAYKAGQVSPSFRASATLWLDDHLGRMQEQAAALQRVDEAGNGGAPLDPASSADRKALNQHFDLAVNQWTGLEPKDVLDRTVAYTVQKGIVPDRLKSMINGAFRAGTPVQQALAADTLERLRNSNPELLKDFSAEAISRGNVIDQYVRYGASPDEAVAKADAMARVDQNVAQARGQEYDKAVVSDYRSGSVTPLDVAKINLAKAFDQGWLYAAPGTDAAIATEYNTVARDEYIKTGNMEAAQKTALDLVQRQWGVSRIGDGTPKMMKFAPEKYFSVPALSVTENTKWMQTQLESDVNASGGLFNSGVEGRLSLVPHPTAISRDGLPVYAVILNGSDGIPRVMTDGTGNPMAWRPDFARSDKAREMQDEREKSVEKARDKRRKKLDGEPPSGAGFTGFR